MKNKDDSILQPGSQITDQVHKENISKCILIYDDNQEILFLCRKLLSKQYRVETLAKCENVLNDIDRIKPNLILMDLWIPEIGGEKAIALIKAKPSVSHIPVLLFSANSSIKEISIKINADGYIEKPFDIYTLKKMIEAYI